MKRGQSIGSQICYLASSYGLKAELYGSAFLCHTLLMAPYTEKLYKSVLKRLDKQISKLKKQQESLEEERSKIVILIREDELTATVPLPLP